MSVLIKGMEIPKEGCKDCLLVKRKGVFDICPFLKREVDGNVERGGKPLACPLVPVPPHGRLIDVDYADEYAYDELEVANYYLTGWEAARAMQKIYQNAPTVIEAEEEQE